MKALKQRGNNVLKLVHSMTFKKRKKKDVDYGRQKKRMWVESGNAILRREQEGLPRAAAGTDQQSVGTNCETKGRVRFTPHTCEPKLQADG